MLRVLCRNDKHFPKRRVANMLKSLCKWNALMICLERTLRVTEELYFIAGVPSNFFSKSNQQSM